MNTAIYIHVPYCRRRCPYCDFYFVVGKPDLNFAASILEEWRERSATWHQGVAQSLYFGGGTPSLLSYNDIEKVINYFRHEGVLAEDAEITLEANPEDINYHHVSELKKAGINRLSLGVQSFDNRILKVLGRKHTNDMAEQAIDAAVHAGISNISVDLILGVPGEVHNHTLKSVDYLLSRVPHVSTYLLTIEEGTHFYKRIKEGRMREPEEDDQVDIYRLVQERLTAHGFLQYDISSYARPGFFSRHNQVYWGMGSYIGLGPSAHSLRFLPDGGLERAQNRSLLKSWLSDPKSDLHFSYDRLNADQALGESLAFGLRNMDQGIDPKKLALRHLSELPKNLGSVAEKLKLNGWLEDKDGHLRITKEGALFADAIMREILCC